MPLSRKHHFEFGEYRLDIDNPALWRGTEIVPILPKALEMLVLLVGKRGAIVSREELLQTLWPDTFVEESNVTYTVSLLRKTLGQNGDGQFIQTLPKRGYRFAAEVREITPDLASDSALSLAQTDPGGDIAAPTVRRTVPWHFIGITLLAIFFATSFAAWWNLDRDGLASIPISDRNFRSVAILPLMPSEDNEANRSLSFGVTDSLISRLGSLNRFAVRPFSSVKSYSESGQDPVGFGRILKVDAVLDGTLQTVGDRVRINLRLLDVRDGVQLWQDTFDAADADLFVLQDTISTRVTRSLADGVLESDRQLLMKRHTEIPEAYQAYIRGRAIFDKKNPGNAEKAMDEYQKAVALDPTFALAYAGFADAFTRLARGLPRGESDEVVGKAKAAGNKALLLDPDLAEAHASLGLIKRLYDWDWSDAEKHFKRAIDLNPNYPNAHLWYAQLLAMVGRGDEALAEVKRAIEIDPLSPDIQAGRLAVLESRGDFAEGLPLALEFANFDKERTLARRGLATFLFHHGDYGAVIEIAEQDLPKYKVQKYVWLSLLATAYHRTGEIEKGQEKLRQLEETSKTESEALYSLAENYAELGRTGEAIAALERCIEVREERLAWVRAEPRFANLKNDPRFHYILRRMNLAG